MIDLVSKPSQDPPASVSSFVYVYYTEAVMYALPTDQCRSWFVSQPQRITSATRVGQSLTACYRLSYLTSTSSGPTL